MSAKLSANLSFFGFFSLKKTKKTIKVKKSFKIENQGFVFLKDICLFKVFKYQFLNTNKEDEKDWYYLIFFKPNKKQQAFGFIFFFGFGFCFFKTKTKTKRLDPITMVQQEGRYVQDVYYVNSGGR